MSCRPRKPRPSTETPMNESGKSLKGLLGEYKRLRRKTPRDDVVSYEQSKSLTETIRRAALGMRDDDKRHSHQARLPKQSLERAKQKLLARENAIRKASDFDALLALVKYTTADIPKLGDLYKYDTALRIGRTLKLSPDAVYLHGGTRDGARALGLPYQKECLSKSDLPPALRLASPELVEDFLCVFKDRLKKSMR